MSLEVQRGMEIAAGVAGAPPLDGVHADRDSTVFVCRHGLGRVREAALALRPLARPAHELAAHLQQ